MLDLWKMKSVAVLCLFAIVLASATAYSSYKSASAQEASQPEAAKCTILFRPETTEIAAGETFTVTVLVDDVKDLWGYELGLTYDRSVIEYVGNRPPSWRFVGGKIEYLFWAAAIIPQQGEVNLIEFTFKGKAEGTSTLGFYAHKLATVKYWFAPKDYVGWPIAHKVAEGLVTVS